MVGLDSHTHTLSQRWLCRSREKEKLQKRNNEVDKLKVQNQSLEGEMTRAVARAGKFQNDLEVASRS